MARYTAQVTTAAALANGNAVASIVPAAAVNFKITSVAFGITTAGAAITDFDVSVGLNRATARGTSSGTATINKVDPNSGGSQITAVDNAWSGQPTLAGADGWLWSFNSRSTLVLMLDELRIISTVGTANPLVFVQRSGAALPASHQITITVEWLE